MPRGPLSGDVQEAVENESGVQRRGFVYRCSPGSYSREPMETHAMGGDQQGRACKKRRDPRPPVSRGQERLSYSKRGQETVTVGRNSGGCAVLEAREVSLLVVPLPKRKIPLFLSTLGQ